MEYRFHALTPDRWPDFERLFGPKGACGGCWCMYWRRPRAEFERDKGEGNRAAMKAAVDSGEVPGILAYRNGEPVAWCALGPRERYPALQRSRLLKPLDDRPVWSVVCFFIRKDHRRRGLSTQLLRAAADFAAARGARLLEGYPQVPVKKMADVFAWNGFLHAFERAGFVECARPSERRRIVRLAVTPAGPLQ
ncbi:MAG TPA: GNAT family N-acetyltransferase [Solibacterales bacterium]|nr:GNAT family N-acetyltransferase [Bryobacterales bacterium]